MRLALLVPVLICAAAPAYAEGARESRYGPTTSRQAAAAAVATRYDGPMLGWSSKRQASIADAPQAATPARVGQTGYPAIPAPVAYAPPRVSNTPSLPTSLYAPPRPAPTASVSAAPGPAKDWSSYRSARVSGVAPTAMTAQPPTPAPTRQVAAANTGATGTTGARYYSVDRDYGLAPDAMPPAGPDNRVLITASEPPPEPRDATPVHGSADWLAAGVAGDDDQDDDSASRRAKTRNEAL